MTPLDIRKRALPVEVLFLVYAVISTSVLGLLCLVVLEYQNGKTRRWNRLWSEYRTGDPPTPRVTLSAVEPSVREALPAPDYEYDSP
ncbi:MAG: hypothetical protein QGI83_00110 [Candidatus Latescibacteria bacterium]|nr:hypothetical protein [Candidatus Latescibacterota bacterium]